MALFGIGKKNEEERKAPTCCCGSDAQAGEAACCGKAVSGALSIKVLGAGCKTCHEQYENAQSAVQALGLNVEVEYITDLKQVMAYGVMSMPAIVVNEQVVSMGKLLKASEVEKLLHSLGL
ncbi:MAG: thioredoxin family protein [Clostridiales bacterium]|nr:thioredoxin family protein [Clostridiales bacterium]